MVGAGELVLKLPIFRLFPALSQGLIPAPPAMNLADQTDPAILSLIIAAPEAYFSLITDHRHLRKLPEISKKY
jgi:hypothetical protein